LWWQRLSRSPLRPLLILFVWTIHLIIVCCWLAANVLILPMTISISAPMLQFFEGVYLLIVGVLFFVQGLWGGCLVLLVATQLREKVIDPPLMLTPPCVVVSFSVAVMMFSSVANELGIAF